MAKKFNLEDFVQEENESAKIEYNEAKYVMLHEEFQKGVGLPGIPLGHISMGYGLSDSGKTEFMLHVAKAAAEQDVLPILIITENKFQEDRLESFGLQKDKNCIIRRDLKHLETVYDYMSQKIHQVKSGALPKNILFLWDSVASTPSVESMEISKDGKIKKKFGPQKNASVIGYYNPIILDMITTTREKDSEYQVGLYMVNQAYVQPSMMPGIPPSIVPNGGEKIWYNLSLTLEFKEGQRLKAKKDGQDYAFGLVSRIKTVKNHVSGLYGENKIVFVDGEVIPNTKDDIEEYKKNNRDKWQHFSSVELEGEEE